MHRSASLAIAVVAVASILLSGCAADPEHSGPKSGASDTATSGNDDPELDDSTLVVLGKYDVDGNELVDANVPEDHAAVWDRFAELFPADSHPEITMFVAIDAEASGGVDGALERNGIDPEQRYIAIDATDYDEPDELDRTLIHEFTHLVTLRATQVTDAIADEDCPLYANRGCPLPGSYLEAWETEFWPDAAAPDFDESDESVEERYDADEYVTEYAATNPDEDIAESFASWVVGDTEASVGTTVADKLAFFEDYPELVQLKTHILAAL
ncbi:hypothetical protein AAIB33_07235 [Microbacterium sp. AZCO]|uniref:hypothetical protein n=1 Tax=Microbacterium sp. AZCO TaxID=3142976 RepID=UPI0031F4417C